MGLFVKKVDPLVGVIVHLTDALEQTRNDHKEHVDQLVAAIKDQNGLLQQILAQYINHGINTNESLNERADRKDQYLKEPEWGPVTVDPFDGEF